MLIRAAVQAIGISESDSRKLGARAFIRGGSPASCACRFISDFALRPLIHPHHPNRWQHIAGGHLYPMKKPLETAAAVAQAIESLANDPQNGKPT